MESIKSYWPYIVGTASAIGAIIFAWLKILSEIKARRQGFVLDIHKKEIEGIKEQLKSFINEYRKVKKKLQRIVKSHENIPDLQGFEETRNRLEDYASSVLFILAKPAYSDFHIEGSSLPTYMHKAKNRVISLMDQLLLQDGEIEQPQISKFKEQIELIDHEEITIRASLARISDDIVSIYSKSIK